MDSRRHFIVSPDLIKVGLIYIRSRDEPGKMGNAQPMSFVNEDNL